MCEIKLSQTTQKENPRKIKYLVVHCTATSPTAKVESIKNYWKQVLKWKSPGYHYIVKADGEIATIHPETLSSNGVQGYNSVSIHISYIGGVDENNKPKDTRTNDQKDALWQALRILKSKYPDAIIQGHRDFPGVSKACPSFNAKAEYKNI